MHTVSVRPTHLERRGPSLDDGVHQADKWTINIQGANVTAANMDRLCRFFACALSELAEYVPDDDVVPVAVVPRAGKRSSPVARNRARSSSDKSR